MSYCSENRLPLNTSRKRLFEIIELLGYQKAKDPLKIEGQIASYCWDGSNDEISFVGIELYVFRHEDCVSVQTRTRMGRSYWDLQQQNKTISLLKSVFGGDFSTDEGNNRYMSFENEEPSKLACSIYVARWRFHNAIVQAKIYLDSRELKGDIAKDNSTGFLWLDSINPRLLSNSMLLPYLIGCWESYFRQLYVSVLKYADGVSEKALKNVRISNDDILSVIRNGWDLADIAADSLSFQRPNVINENFKQLDSNIKIQSWLSKPYHRRKQTLFDSITTLVKKRDLVVHTGYTDLTLFDKELEKVINDLIEAANRVYNGLGEVFKFTPNYNF